MGPAAWQSASLMGARQDARAASEGGANRALAYSELEQRAREAAIDAFLRRMGLDLGERQRRDALQLGRRGLNNERDRLNRETGFGAAGVATGIIDAIIPG